MQLFTKKSQKIAKNDEKSRKNTKNELIFKSNFQKSPNFKTALVGLRD